MFVRQWGTVLRLCGMIDHLRYSRKNNNHWRMRINLQGERGLCTLMECSIDCFSTIKEQWSQWRELGVNEDFLIQRWVSVWFHTVVCIICSTEVLDFVYIIWGTEVWDFCNVCRSYQKVLVQVSDLDPII